MRASVVIPTYNRLHDLKNVLAALAGQDIPAGCELEIVVVDDGSDDDTRIWLDAHGRSGGWSVVRQKNSGPAAARNRGVTEASGELVLFLGDDTEPQPGWLVAHLEEHRLFGARTPLAVLGYTSFASEMDGPFARFINEYGAQFGYLLIDDPSEVPFNFFYTSNVSLSRRLFLELGGFREDFPAAAWEDIEFAYRARERGLGMRYQPRARTVHHHCVRPRTFCRRQRTSGHSAAIFARLHPELRHFLGLETLRYRPVVASCQRLVFLAAVAIGERIEGLVPHRVYRRFLDLCYQRGLAGALHLLNRDE